MAVLTEGENRHAAGPGKSDSFSGIMQIKARIISSDGVSPFAH